MDFRTLTYFVTVAQELNFTHAADKLNMSQPPLSNQIRLLEEDLGADLFVRGKRHLQLTEAGRRLLRRANQILDLCETARQEVKAVGNELSGDLRLGIVEGRAPFITARWIAGFHRTYPRVTYSLRNGSSDEVIDQLFKGLVDLAVIAAPYDNEHLEGIKLGEEPWVAILPSGSPLAGEPGNTIELKKLDGIPLVLPARRSRLESIQKWFASAGIEPNVMCTLSSFVDAEAIAEQGVAVSIFPQTYSTDNPKVVPKVIVNPAKLARYLVVWEKADPPRGLAQTFLSYIRQNIDSSNVRNDVLSAGGPDGSDIDEGKFLAIPEGADLL